MKLLQLLLIFVSTSVFADSYNQPLQCQAIGISLNSPSTSATVQCPSQPPPPPPSGTGACTSGYPADLSGFTAYCIGTFQRYAGSFQPVGPTAFTFPAVFKAAWPGASSGYAEIFTMAATQYLSIPFVPTPGHTVSLGLNTTFMPNNNAAFSVSTQPGVFTGPSVICSGLDGNPNLTLSSNGYAGGCNLSPNVQYWFNAAPGQFDFSGNFVACRRAPCKISVQEQLVN